MDAKWKWKRKHAKAGVMLGLPNRYGKYSIFCSRVPTVVRTRIRQRLFA